MHKYHKNNPKEMKLFCMIYSTGELYTIVADDSKKQCDFRHYLYNSIS